MLPILVVSDAQALSVVLEVNYIYAASFDVAVVVEGVLAVCYQHSGVCGMSIYAHFSVDHRVILQIMYSQVMINVLIVQWHTLQAL